MKVLRTILALVLGLGSAYYVPFCSSKDGLSKVAANGVIYQFPDIPGLGTLETRVTKGIGSESLDRMASRRHTIAHARGTVRISAEENKGVYFAPGQALTMKPELMKSISPENIQGFFFSFTSTGDSEDAIADRLVANISHLKNLCYVRLGRCDVSDVGFTGLHDLPKLTNLDVSYSLITSKSMPVLAKLTSLEELTLNSVDLRHSDFSYLGRLPKLSVLYLKAAQVNDAMIASLKPSKSLISLDLTNNSAVTDASLPAIAALPSLKTVCLTGTSVNLRSLTKLARIANVVISRSELRGASLSEMQKTMPNLKLDNATKPSSAQSRPGAEEMHLFAPTRF
ncbi:MAG: hypothetical protein WCT03_15055 [Candidatus Obscuribacterales bacterium]